MTGPWVETAAGPWDFKMEPSSAPEALRVGVPFLRVRRKHLQRPEVRAAPGGPRAGVGGGWTEWGLRAKTPIGTGTAGLRLLLRARGDSTEWKNLAALSSSVRVAPTKGD